ncbi:MAG TPA: TlpA disulfide reductase family protein [Terriglobales bacterium]|nr:TlpA disulfide reductase family protein [Terriglobales bacterium]
MKRNAAAVVVIALVVAVMIFAGVRNSSRPKVSPMIGNPEPISSAEAKGKQAPDFTLQDLQGKQVKLSDFRGKAVLLNFWATFCGPCKVEMPWLVELQKQYGPQGFEIVGVALDDSGKDKIEKFAKEMGVNYTILQGQDAVGDAYGAVGLPATYYIDRSGKIIDSALGLVSRSEIEDNIKKSLAEGKSEAETASSRGKATS